MADWTGGVLAGGRSRRMGRTKAFLPGSDGRPLIAGALDALRAAGAQELLISANDPEPFAELGVPVVADRRSEQGPLAGLESLLEAASHPWLVVVACDMPQLDPKLLRRIADEALAGEAPAVVPQAGGRVQPLHAAYHRRCLPALREALAEGRLAVHRLVDALGARLLACPAEPFLNLNTLDDLRAAGLEPGC